MITDLAQRLTEAAQKMMTAKPTMPFDPFAVAKATTDYAMSLAMRPQDRAADHANQQERQRRNNDSKVMHGKRQCVPCRPHEGRESPKIEPDQRRK